MKNESTLKKNIRSAIFMIPGTQKLWTRWIVGKKSIYTFVGWGMATMTNPPWADPKNSLAKDFLETHDEVVKAILDGRFTISQFEKHPDKEELLKSLMWRHYVVFWSARYAQFSGSTNIVECGVCDGLTVYFALRALGSQYKAWLFDAWEAMPDERLLESEKSHSGDYAYLTVEKTKKNLSKFNTEFIKGFIPESFASGKKPQDVGWLHVDLNASIPTTDSLREFYSRIPAGGVILFDDYAGKGFTDTKKAIDSFFSDKKGILLHMPTGQGIFFKK
ncbi:MAG: class I SAM-dependent methyltransferase [bacterium]|nr:class I SAM-dependent methyltransferase [bacterium]